MNKFISSQIYTLNFSITHLKTLALFPFLACFLTPEKAVPRVERAAFRQSWESDLT